jgi:anti-anti-sigma factor
VDDRIEVSHDDSETAVVTLHGEHDLSTSRLLESVLQGLLWADCRVIVDLSVAEFIDSAILTALLASDRLARQRGRRLTLQVATAPGVRRVLEVSGLAELLPCESTREGAIAAAWRDVGFVG